MIIINDNNRNNNSNNNNFKNFLELVGTVRMKILTEGGIGSKASAHMNLLESRAKQIQPLCDDHEYCTQFQNWEEMRQKQPYIKDMNKNSRGSYNAMKILPRKGTADLGHSKTLCTFGKSPLHPSPTSLPCTCKAFMQSLKRLKPLCSTASQSS